jgi:hypothetical protein
MTMIILKSSISSHRIAVAKNLFHNENGIHAWGLQKFNNSGSETYFSKEPEPVFLNVFGAQESTKALTPPAFVAWRADTITLFLLGT